MNQHSPISEASEPLMTPRRVAMLGALLAAIGPVSMALFTPAMEELVRVFGTTESAVKLTLSSYFAGFAIAQLFAGPISDALGRKPVTYAFMGIYLAASLLAFVAPSVEILIVARLLQGVGAAAGIAISRALVRDLFTGERSARIMNVIGLILGIGPAASPTLGGFLMEAFGWHSIFIAMVVMGVAIILAARFVMVETVSRDMSRLKPRALIGSYGTLLKSGYFMGSSLSLGGAIGALYAVAVILPFILMGRLGLTPSQFGLGMLLQSGLFFLGSLTVARLLRSANSKRLVPFGLVLQGLASAFLLAHMLLRTGDPSFLSVMLPIGIYAFGIAFVMPAMTTAALAPFPHMAGAASSLSGFIQIGTGLLGSLLASLIGDPLIALGVVVPGMGVLAISGWLFWRTRPEPILARVAAPHPPAEPGAL